MRFFTASVVDKNVADDERRLLSLCIFPGRDNYRGNKQDADDESAQFYHVRFRPESLHDPRLYPRLPGVVNEIVECTLPFRRQLNCEFYGVAVVLFELIRLLHNLPAIAAIQMFNHT